MLNLALDCAADHLTPPRFLKVYRSETLDEFLKFDQQSDSVLVVE